MSSLKADFNELVQRIHQTAKEARVEENLGDGYDVFFHSEN